MDVKKSIKSSLSTARLIARTAAASIIPGPPPYLIFFVTRRCNGNCPFCFDRGREPGPGPELSLDEIKQIARNWRRVIQVTLTGGEPFLRDDVLDIARAWLDAGAASLTIATNGTMTERITATVTALLHEHPDLALDLNISIDGPPELHDRLRGIPGAHTAAMNTARNLAPLHDRHPGFRTGATLTVSAMNQDTAAETLTDLAAGGLFRRLQAVLVRGQPVDPDTLDVKPDAYSQCIKVLDEFNPGGGQGRIKSALSGLVRETVDLTAREDRLVRPCRAGEKMVEMDAWGRVFPCEILPQTRPGAVPEKGIDDWELGSMRDNDFQIEKIMTGPRARAIAAWVRGSGCYCTFECAAYANVVFSPGHWPEVVKRIARKP